MSISETEKTDFAAMVKRRFTFLESDVRLSLVGVHSVDEGPRDSYVVVRYRRGAQRVDVAWGPVEMSLGILLRLEKEGLARREQGIYAEPFIVFITEGKTAPVVPQIYPGMSVGRIQRVMDLRAQMLPEGLAGAVEMLANRLKAYYPEIRAASVDTIRAYHRWYKVQHGRIDTRLGSREDL